MIGTISYRFSLIQLYVWHNGYGLAARRFQQTTVLLIKRT
jgi:hypothetical protein